MTARRPLAGSPVAAGWRGAALLALIALASLPAAAVTLTDDEPANDSVATAGIDIVPPPGVSTHAGELVLVAGDIDFLGIGGLSIGDIITVTTTPLDDAALQVPDTIVGVFDNSATDPTHMILCRGDDTPNNDLDNCSNGECPGYGSLCRYQITAPGSYFVGVTGFRSKFPPSCDPAAPPGDPDECDSHPFDGGVGPIPCEETGPTFTCGSYQVTVALNALPEPGAVAQLVAGGIGLAWLQRRRRRALARSTWRFC